MIGILRNSRRREGFALLELLISIAILGAVLGTVYLLYFQSRQVLGAFSARDRRMRRTSALVDRLRLDLSGVTDRLPTSPTASVGREGGPDGEVVLRFVSILQRGTAPSAPHLVTYFLREEPDGGRRDLFRREGPPSGPGGPPPTDVRFLEDVDDVRVETYDGRTWTDGWRATGGFPRLVRLSLASGKGPGRGARSAYVFELPVQAKSGAAVPSAGESEAAGSAPEGGGDSSPPSEEGSGASPPPEASPMPEAAPPGGAGETSGEQ